MPKRLEGKVALVTGGSRGIGRATSMVLAGEGAAVIVNYTQNSDAAMAVSEAIRQNDGSAMALQADVSQKAQVQAMVDKAVREYGRIDILVNNAGVFSRSTTMTIDDEGFDRMVAVNVKGIINCVQAVAPGMVSRHYGKIVNISSLGGLGTAVGDSTSYAVTKAAVIALTKRQAFEFSPEGINVNAVCPGLVHTEMLKLGDPPDPKRLEALGRKAMLGRIGKPEEIARTVLFLASDDSSFMTAQAISVDGGRMDLLSHSG